MKPLLIIFVKNIILGKVKTRLAKAVGTEGAFEVYRYMVDCLEKETSKLNCDKHIYFSDVIIEKKWPDDQKFIQMGADIGERMKNAFQSAFSKGYEKVVLIGSDIPDLSTHTINDAFHKLNSTKAVFGPAEDGGYYLVGLSEMNDALFEGIEWSTKNVLKQSILNVDEYQLTETLNDIDTIEDLRKSSINQIFKL